VLSNLDQLRIDPISGAASWCGWRRTDRVGVRILRCSASRMQLYKAETPADKTQAHASAFTETAKGCVLSMRHTLSCIIATTAGMNVVRRVAMRSRPWALAAFSNARCQLGFFYSRDRGVTIVFMLYRGIKFRDAFLAWRATEVRLRGAPRSPRSGMFVLVTLASCAGHRSICG